MRIRLRPVVFILATVVIAGSVLADGTSAVARARVHREGAASANVDARLIAQGDWAALADRFAPGPEEAPDVSALSRAIVFADLAGRDEDVDALATRLLDHAAAMPADADAVAAALLLADHGDAALNVLQDAGLSRSAFVVLMGEMRVADALALPVAEQDTEMALQRAHALGALGSTDAARAELEGLAQPTRKGDVSSRAVREMAVFGWDSAALERGAALIEGHAQPNVVLPAIFPRSGSEAIAAWRFIQAAEPGIDPGTALIRVAQALDPATRSADADTMLAEAPKSAAGLTSCEQVRFFDGMAGIADLRGQEAIATQLLKQWADSSDAGLAWMALGDRSFDAGRFAEAATQYAHAGAAMPAEPVPAYLQALSLEKAGRVQEAAAARIDAEERAQADVGSRQRLACAMDRAGDLAAARAQRELVVTEGAPGSPAVVAAAQSLGQRERCAGSRVTAVADFDRARAQAVLAPALGIAKVADVARLSQGARLDAAVAGGAADGILALSERTLAPFLDDVDATADLLRSLDVAGRGAEADALFQRVFDRMALAASDVPSARLLNGVAWFAARSARELAAGETAARRAVELSPNSAAYADTLAEVLFQQGNREEAIVEGARALALAREPRYHESQLARLRTGSPSSRPPIE